MSSRLLTMACSRRVVLFDFGQNSDATIENSQQNTEKKSRIYFEGDACATPKLADQSLVANLSAPICRVIMF